MPCLARLSRVSFVYQAALGTYRTTARQRPFQLCRRSELTYDLQVFILAAWQR